MNVPDFGGLSYREAIHLGETTHLHVSVAVDNKPALSPVGRPLGVVIAQDPAPGTPVDPPDWVYIWLDTGRGGGGVREPRRPGPDVDRATQRMTDAAG